MVCLHRPLHRPAETGPLDQLLGHVLGHQLGLKLGAGNLFDLDVDPPADQRLQLVLEDCSTSWPLRPMITPGRAAYKIDLHFIAGTLNLHLGNAGKLVFVVHVVTNLLVFDQAGPQTHASRRTSGFSSRGRCPVRYPVRIDFLSHGVVLSAVGCRLSAVGQSFSSSCREPTADGRWPQATPYSMVTRIWEKPFFDDVGHAACSGADPLEHRAAVDPGIDHPQAAPMLGAPKVDRRCPGHS